MLLLLLVILFVLLRVSVHATVLHLFIVLSTAVPIRFIFVMLSNLVSLFSHVHIALCICAVDFPFYFLSGFDFLLSEFVVLYLCVVEGLFIR